MHPQDFEEPQAEATRQILLGGWSALSEGDLSLVLSALRTGGGFLTMAGSPLDRFLEQLLVFEWVEPSDLLTALAEIPDIDLRSYRLTEDGERYLLAFIDHYHLMFVGTAACAMRVRLIATAEAARAPKSRLLRALRRLDLFVDANTTVGLVLKPHLRRKRTARETCARFVLTFTAATCAFLAFQAGAELLFGWPR